MARESQVGMVMQVNANSSGREASGPRASASRPRGLVALSGDFPIYFHVDAASGCIDPDAGQDAGRRRWMRRIA
jgi:hypothetical protein